MPNTKKIFKKSAGHCNMGQMIKEVIKEQKMSVSDFAKAIHCSRTNVYSIFGRESINIERLEQIADVLKLDISDFITIEKKSGKCIAVIEIDNEKLKQLSNEYELTYIKSWKMK